MAMHRCAVYVWASVCESAVQTDSSLIEKVLGSAGGDTGNVHS